MRQPERQVENMRRHLIRVGHILDIHPPNDGFVLVIVPVDCGTDGPNGEEDSAGEHDKEGKYNYPLPRVEFNHLMGDGLGYRSD